MSGIPHDPTGATPPEPDPHQPDPHQPGPQQPGPQQPGPQQPGPQPGPEQPGPEQEVSRLLREAAGTGPLAQPLPAEVAARLDETLAALVRDRAGAPLAAEPTNAAAPADLSAHREGRLRRRAGTLVLAAATVVVAGIAVGTTVDGWGSDSASESAVAGTDGTAESSDGGSERGSALDDGTDLATAPESAQAEGAGPPAAEAPPGGPDPRLRSRTLAADLAALLAAGDAPAAPTSPRLGREDCRTPRVTGDERVWTVTYDGERATLVTRARGEVTRARVYDCRLGLLLDAATVSTPGAGE